MIKITLEKMIKITEGVITLPSKTGLFDHIEIDSRRVNATSYFMPILGEVHDGHKFIKNAFENGVEIAFCEKAYYYSHQSDLKSYPLILVDNTTTTLHRISRYILDETQVRTIGITGSVGKTSTKEFVYHVLKDKYNVHKNKGNFNNHIGMPLTIFDLELDHDVVILEMGMNHFKEIEVLADIARPEVAVVTNIGTSHIGILGSRENIFQAKMEITSYLKDDQTLIINYEDDFLPLVDDTSFNCIRVHQDMMCENITLRSDGCYDFTLNYKGLYPVSLQVLGKHNITNSMLAIAVGVSMGVSIEEACKNVSDYKDSSKRLEILKGKMDSVIINDCYNASQESMISAIEVLNTFDQKKIAVLGDVLELGDFAQVSHETVGAYISEHPVDYLLTFGKDSEYIINKAIELGYKNYACHFENIDDLYVSLENLIEEKVVLVKGSFGMGMARIVDFLGGEHDIINH